jgi:hypothetical protein
MKIRSPPTRFCSKDFQTVFLTKPHRLLAEAMVRLSENLMLMLRGPKPLSAMAAETVGPLRSVNTVRVATVLVMTVRVFVQTT